MRIYLLTHITMTKKSGLLTAVATATVLATSPVNAETPDNSTKQKIEQKEVNKKVEQISCKTKLACEALSNSIQAQINDLEKKGLANLTNEEFAKFGNLKKQLIALERQETQHNSNIIAVENSKQKEQEVTIKDNEKIMAQLSSIKGSL